VTRLLLAYDASAAARAAVAAAAAFFPGATAEVACAGPAADALAEGVELASAAGLAATGLRLEGDSAWRALQARIRATRPDAVVCGAPGRGRHLGSTATGLLHHGEVPLLVVPPGVPDLEGRLLAGYDDSPGASAALRFAATYLPDRPVVVAHAWRSPIRHSLRGHAFLGSGVATLHEYATDLDHIFAEIAADIAEEGADYAARRGLRVQSRAVESGKSTADALLEGARVTGAAALLVGSRGHGALGSTVLGSTAADLVHAAELPVIVVPPRR
jgi:nucleotide-binding universal stress UspA family protein